MIRSAAREELLESLAAFAAGTDHRDWESLRAMLTDDAHAYGTHGGDAVITTMQEFLGGVGPTQHLLGNHRLRAQEQADPGRGEEERVRILSYGRVHHVGAGPMTGASYECLGEYDDTWIRRGGVWLLHHRWFEVTAEIGEPAVLRPAD